jgi:hypothetical protein
VKLSFEFTKANMPVVRGLLSDRPQQWVVLPSPPLKSDFWFDDSFAKATQLWWQEVAPYTHQGTGSGGLIQVGLSMPMPMPGYDGSSSTLTLETSPMGIIFPDANNYKHPQERLVDTLKSLLSKCGRKS